MSRGGKVVVVRSSHLAVKVSSVATDHLTRVGHETASVYPRACPCLSRQDLFPISVSSTGHCNVFLWSVLASWSASQYYSSRGLVCWGPDSHPGIVGIVGVRLILVVPGKVDLSMAPE